jgi:hypothetical protein
MIETIFCQFFFFFFYIPKINVTLKFFIKLKEEKGQEKRKKRKKKYFGKSFCLKWQMEKSKE